MNYFFNIKTKFLADSAGKYTHTQKKTRHVKYKVSFKLDFEIVCYSATDETLSLHGKKEEGGTYMQVYKKISFLDTIYKKICFVLLQWINHMTVNLLCLQTMTKITFKDNGHLIIQQNYHIQFGMNVKILLKRLY